MLADGLQLGLDISHFVRAESASVVEVEGVMQLIFFLDGWCQDAFACHVPSFSFVINGNGGFVANG